MQKQPMHSSFVACSRISMSIGVFERMPTACVVFISSMSSLFVRASAHLTVNPSLIRSSIATWWMFSISRILILSFGYDV
jgi:hypothetical protein